MDSKKIVFKNSTKFLVFQFLKGDIREQISDIGNWELHYFKSEFAKHLINTQKTSIDTEDMLVTEETSLGFSRTLLSYKLEKLVSLRIAILISNNQYMYVFFAISNLPSLTHLFLDIYQLPVIAYNEMEQCLKSLTDLLSFGLDFGENSTRQIYCEQISKLISSFTKLTKLQLQLYNQQIKEEGMISLSKAIATLSNLNHLKFLARFNSFTDRSVDFFLRAMQCCAPNLRHLSINFSQNHLLTDESFLQFSSLTPLLKNLHTFSLNLNCIAKNKLNSHDVIKSFSELKNSLSTLHLNIGKSDIGNDTFSRICLVLKNFTNLERLVLSCKFNYIGISGIFVLSKCLKSILSNLKCLIIDLSENLVCDDSLKILLKVFKFFKPEILELDVANQRDVAYPISEERMHCLNKLLSQS